MLLAEGDKVHVINRRRFENDTRRRFVGEVTAVTESAVRAEGYVFVWDSSRAEFTKRPDLRTRILSLTDADNNLCVLPDDTEIDQIRYEVAGTGHLVAMDGETVALDIQEFGGKR